MNSGIPRADRARGGLIDRPAAATLLARFGRTGRDLRVSVTEPCSLRRTDRMPAKRRASIPHRDLMTFQRPTASMGALGG